MVWIFLRYFDEKFVRSKGRHTKTDQLITIKMMDISEVSSSAKVLFDFN